MNKNLATKILIVLLAAIAIGFVLFYFFVVRNRTVVDGDLAATGNRETSGSPIYPNTSGAGSDSASGSTAPLGRGSTRDTETEEGSGSTGTGEQTYPGRVVNSVPVGSVGSLFLISDKPVSGATTLVDDGAPVVRYMERERGNIYDFPIGENRSERISIETIRKVHEAFFADGGSTVVARYLDEGTNAPRTYRAKLTLTDDPATKGMYRLEGSYLPDGISDVSVSPSGKSLFYLIADQDGASGFAASPASQAAVRVFDSPAREWLSVWANDRSVALVTRPSGNVTGYSYALNTQTETQTELLPPSNGVLVNPSPDLSYVLAFSGGRGILSSVVGRNGEENSDLVVRTLPDKCVWSGVSGEHVLFCGVPANPPSAMLPDDWLLGTVSYGDELWRFDVDAGTAEQVVGSSQFSLGPVDVFRPVLTKDEKYLIFMNKRDLSLWGARIAD